MGSRNVEPKVPVNVLGARLRQLREGLGFVLQDVADLFSTNRNVPSQWEGGQRQPSYEHLLRLADYYGVTVDWLLGREGAERDSPSVKRVKGQLADYLRLKESSLQGKTPGERLQTAVEFLSGQDAEMFSLARLSRQLLISDEALRQIIFGQAMVLGPVIQRFAQFAYLPELWFYQPAPQLEDAGVKYKDLVQRFQADGLSPSEVEQRVWGSKRAQIDRSRSLRSRS
jgi:transcriptional regulator with XRE-family HTH domain